MDSRTIGSGAAVRHPREGAKRSQFRPQADCAVLTPTRITPCCCRRLRPGAVPCADIFYVLTLYRAGGRASEAQFHWQPPRRTVDVPALIDQRYATDTTDQSRLSPAILRRRTVVGQRFTGPERFRI